MVLYTCPRCNYITNQLGDMRKHFKRKTPCTIVNKTLSIDECMSSLDLRKTLNSAKSPEDSKILRGDKKKTGKTSKKGRKKDPKSGNMKNESNFEDFACSKSFIRLDDHKLTPGQDRKTKNPEDKTIISLQIQLNYEKKLREHDRIEILDLKKQIGVLLDKVGHTTYNNTFNITINPFGKENTSYITESYVNNLIGQGPYESIPRLLEYIHFNPEHKENHNIKISNKKQPYAQVYNGEKWLLKNKKQTIEHMSDNAYTILNEHYDGSNVYMNKFNEDFGNHRNDLIRKVVDGVQLLILNSGKT